METEKDSSFVRSCPGLGESQYSLNFPQQSKKFPLFLEEVPFPKYYLNYHSTTTKRFFSANLLIIYIIFQLFHKNI